MSTTTRERLEAAVADLERYGDDLDAKGQAVSGEDLGELKTRMEAIKDLKAQVTAEAEAKGATADAKAFLKELAGGGDDKPDTGVTVDGLPMNPQGKTLGEMFTESPAFADFKSRYAGRDGLIPNAVKGIQSGPFSSPDLKALLTGASATSAGAAVRNDFYAPITDLIGERPITIYDLITKGSTTSDTVEYVRVTAKTNNAAGVAEATDALPGAVSGATPGPYAVAAASGVKPESSLALEVVSAAVQTIAHWIPITKRAASDAPQVRTLVDNFLRYGLQEQLEDEILNGSGAPGFTGILQSTPLTVGSAGTDIDAIVDAIAAVEVTGRRRPTALVIHPSDWYSTGFLLAKESTGAYLVGDPRASIQQLNTLWGLTVVVTEAMTQNTALVGDFHQAILWEREGVSLMVSDQHADFFTRNLLAILAEMRAAFGILDIQGFCTVTAV